MGSGFRRNIDARDSSGATGKQAGTVTLAASGVEHDFSRNEVLYRAIPLLMLNRKLVERVGLLGEKPFTCGIHACLQVRRA
jgi:hypothetical protein